MGLNLVIYLDSYFYGKKMLMWEYEKYFLAICITSSNEI